MKKIFYLIVTIFLLSSGGYFGYKQFEIYSFTQSMTPHIKNISLRVTNDINNILNGENITYKELFERLDVDIAEIEKNILEVQVQSTNSTKVKTDAIVAYMRSSQEFLRSVSLMSRKNLAVSSATEWSKKQMDEVESDPNQFNLKSAKKSLDDARKAIEESKESLKSVGTSLQKLIDTRRTMASVMPVETLIEQTLLSELMEKFVPKQKSASTPVDQKKK